MCVYKLVLQHKATSGTVLSWYILPLIYKVRTRDEEIELYQMSAVFENMRGLDK